MELISWNDKLDVGIEEFNHQHKELVKVLNALYDAMRQGKSQQLLEKSLQELAEYTVYHFRSEEEAFDKYNYPDKALHKKEHQLFIKKVQEFQADYKAGKVLVSMDLLQFLSEWVTGHIMKSDMKYRAYLQKN